MSEILDVTTGVGATHSDSAFMPSYSGTPGPPRLSAAAQARRHNLAVAWCVATVIGGLIIHAVPGLSLARLLAPVTAMLAYVVYGLAQRQRNTAKLADSVYFMGFLWTLFALVDTLIGGDVVRLDAVFRVFGYALITTGCGMFIRLLLIQFSETVSDQITDAREDVDQEVRAFLTQMRTGTLRMTEFADACHAATSDFANDLQVAGQQVGSVVGRICSDSMAELVKDVKAGTTALAREIGALADITASLKMEVLSTTKGITTSSRRVDATLSKTAEDLDQSGKRLHQTLDGLNTFLSDPRGPAVDIVQRMNDLVSQVSATAHAVQRLADECSQGVQERLRELKHAFAEIPGKPELRLAAEDLTASLTGTAQELTRVADTAKPLTDSISRSSVILEQALKTLTATSQQANDSATKIQKSVSEVVQFTRDRLASQ